MKRLVLVAAMLAAGAVHAQDTALLQQGAAAFSYNCAPCHGDGGGKDGAAALPGTFALGIKYKGAKPALLEKRTDLPAPVLKVFVRNGSFAMPPFRKTEVSDADIVAIAAYLQSTAKAGRP